MFFNVISDCIKAVKRYGVFKNLNSRKRHVDRKQNGWLKSRTRSDKNMTQIDPENKVQSGREEIIREQT